MEKFLKGSTSRKWKSTNPRQKELTNCIVAFTAHDLLPLSLVESERFRILMATAEPMFIMPSRKHLSTVLLPQYSTTIQTQLKTQLQQVKNLCLTKDLWSSRDNYEASIETRLKKFESTEEFQLAATSDPRYKLDWCHDNEVQDIRDLLTVK
ncbi:hypothetical protein Pcinc_004954 [Petrolisthes cinctipes]|uniref:Uncharacterized protein n=1 Tax=Petrolisthes cinctipes TaxID=88211 RepID=A0AAE1GEG0_PETCI|nr:hypothetical protein Pcinc_004954 [Petrolisthes cinctipes]